MTSVFPQFHGERVGRESVICPQVTTERRTMSDRYIIEVNSQAAGVVVRNAEGFRFFAASHAFDRMEGKLYRNAGEAERAAQRLAKTD
jgi:hypothetical protein